VKTKEADKVIVPAYPNALTLYTWKTSLMRAVVVAADKADYDGVIKWICQSWQVDKVSDLDSPGAAEYVMLDFKLAEGMDKMLTNGGEKSKRLKQKVDLQMEAATREGKILKGRQIVWMVCESFKTHDRSDLLFTFDHLAQVEVRNHDLHDFMIQWNHVLDNMGHNSISQLMLGGVFFRKIQRENALFLALNAYEHYPESHPEKTYQWLLGRVEAVTKVQEQRKNMLEKKNSY
jgi:hypothetical protein